MGTYTRDHIQLTMLNEFFTIQITRSDIRIGLCQRGSMGLLLDDSIYISSRHDEMKGVNGSRESQQVRRCGKNGMDNRMYDEGR